MFFENMESGEIQSRYLIFKLNISSSNGQSVHWSNIDRQDTGTTSFLLPTDACRKVYESWICHIIKSEGILRLFSAKKNLLVLLESFLQLLCSFTKSRYAKRLQNENYIENYLRARNFELCPSSLFTKSHIKNNNK